MDSRHRSVWNFLRPFTGYAPARGHNPGSKRSSERMLGTIAKERSTANKSALHAKSWKPKAGFIHNCAGAAGMGPALWHFRGWKKRPALRSLIVISKGTPWPSHGRLG